MRSRVFLPKIFGCVCFLFTAMGLYAGSKEIHMADSPFSISHSRKGISFFYMQVNFDAFRFVQVALFHPSALKIT